MVNVKVSKCDACASQFYLDFDGLCSACGCDAQGSSVLDCDANGNCLCLDGYTGTNCEICSVGYYAYGGICTGQSNKLFVKIFLRLCTNLI